MTNTFPAGHDPAKPVRVSGVVHITHRNVKLYRGWHEGVVHLRLVHAEVDADGTNIVLAKPKKRLRG